MCLVSHSVCFYPVQHCIHEQHSQGSSAEHQTTYTCTFWCGKAAPDPISIKEGYPLTVVGGATIPVPVGTLLGCAAATELNGEPERATGWLGCRAAVGSGKLALCRVDGDDCVVTTLGADETV